MNQSLKVLIERALVGGGLPRLARARQPRESSLILAYHDIVPTGHATAGDASLHLPQREFARQLDAIQETCEVVALPALLQPAAPRARPRVAITFDDAYAGALSAGVIELESRSMPATVFVAPALLDQTPWWDQLAGSGGEVTPEVRHAALWQYGGMHESVLEWAAKTGASRAALSSHPRIGTLAELEEAAARPGLTLGSHSWSHANLCALSAEALDRELALPLQWLGERFSCSVPILSYPYGLHSPATEQAATRLGYQAALRVEGGWYAGTLPANAYAMPRFNVPAGLSLDGFRLRLAGLGAR